MPVLGICGGQQLLNVVLGGTLIQHIPDSVAEALAHEQPNPRTEPGHAVAIVAGTLLHRIAGRRPHARSTAPTTRRSRDAGPRRRGQRAGARTAWSRAIEDPRRRFCLGVQWHPEYAIDPADPLIFAAFVQAAAG